MGGISRDSLLSLEAYAKERPEFRRRVIAHKKARTVRLGDNISLIFEDELTIRYQIQEMLHAERIFEEAGIRDELEAYNPLVSDANNLKATMLIEYDDIETRREMLGKLVGVEHTVWIEALGQPRILAIADEDLERSTADKTAAVHFLRFPLNAGLCDALRGAAKVALGIDHPHYPVHVTLDERTCAALWESMVGETR